MIRTILLLGCAACASDPHAAFFAPPGHLTEGAVVGTHGPLDNLVLNPSFVYPTTAVNSIGFGMSGGWNVVHLADTPTGQPAVEGYVSMLVRLRPTPLVAEVWVSGEPADVTETFVTLLFTDSTTLEDREVELAPVEERPSGERVWARYAIDMAGAEGMGLLTVDYGNRTPPLVSGPVVRVAEPGLRRALAVDRPVDPKHRAVYESFRPGSWAPHDPSSR